MAWLLREGDVLAVLDSEGQGWPAAIQGAVLKKGPVLVHTFASAGSLDLAWCQEATTQTGEPCLEVRRIACLHRHRVARPQLKGGAVIAAEEGAFERWHLRVGDRLEIKET
jgi:hypothetical protein